MVESKSLMLDEHRAPFEGLGNLGHSDDRVVQQGEKDCSTFCEEPGRCLGSVIKAGSGNQGHDQRQDLFDQECGFLPPQNLILAPRTCENLGPKSSGERTLLWLVCGLFEGNRLLECLRPLLGNCACGIVVFCCHVAVNS